MRRRKRTPLRSALGLASVALGAATAASPAGAQERAGVAGAVVPQASSAKPGSAVQTLTVGAEVVRNERIATDVSGRANLLFLDQTSITVGPNSEVTIDQFVYNPAQNTGEAAVTVGRGVMRFVGGRLSKAQDATIRTPVATIGVRGAIAITEIQPDGAALVVFVYGDRITVRAPSGASRALTQAGLGLIARPNGTIDGPFAPSPDLLERLLTLLGPAAGSTGAGVPDVSVPATFDLPQGINLQRLRDVIQTSRPSLGY